MLLGRFANDAKTVILSAAREAERGAHRTVHPIHLLIGLLSLHSGIAHQVLAEKNLSVDACKDVAGKCGGIPPEGGLAFSAAAIEILGAAAQEAQAQRDSNVRAEHILLGLFQVKESGDVLHCHGLDTKTARKRIEELVDKQQFDAAVQEIERSPFADSFRVGWRRIIEILGSRFKP